MVKSYNQFKEHIPFYRHKIPNKLFIFLKEREILNSFMHNFEIQHPNKLLYKYNKDKPLNQWIISSFNWNSTIDGKNFWFNINREWQDCCKTHIYEKLEDDFEEIWLDDESLIDERYKKHKHKGWLFYDYMMKGCHLYAESILYNFIDAAFIWKHTPEGHEFWSEIQNEWRNDYLKNNAEKYYRINDLKLYEKLEDDFEEVWEEEEYKLYNWRELKIEDIKDIFNVGDRVECSFSNKNRDYKSYVGTIRYIGYRLTTDAFIMGIEFNNYINGHNGLNEYDGKEGYCWNFGKTPEIYNDTLKIKKII